MFKPLAIRKMQINTSCYFILPTSEWPRSTNQMTMNAKMDAGKGAHLFAVGESTNCYNHCGNQCVLGYRQNIEIDTGLPYDSVYHCWVYFK